MSKKTKKLLCILLSAVLLISLSGCGSSKKSSGSSSKISAKETVAKSTTETASKTSGSSSKSSFSMRASNGQNLEAKVGFMVCFDTVSSAPSCDHNPSVLLPYLGDYVSGISTIHDEISYSSSGYYGTNYSFDGKPDKASVKKYVDALSSYGCTLEYTWGGSGSTTAYYLNCSKKITHGTISLAAREYYDLSVTVYEKEKFVSIYYPKEIWFDYSSLGGGVTTEAVTSKAKTRNANNRITFEVSGYGEKGDYLLIGFDPDAYSTGNTLKKKDFDTQDKSNSALCKVAVFSSKYSVDYSGVTDVELKILESSDSVTAVSFMVAFMAGTEQHKVEGIAVSESITDNTANSGGGGGATIVNPIPSGKTKCSSCGGTGREKCHACGGDGLEICPNCKGTGKYYEQTYGQTTGIYRDCKRCKGGHINCSRCVDGTVSCTACGGDGYR